MRTPVLGRRRGRSSGTRAGCRTVARLADELNVRILRAMVGDPRAYTTEEREEARTGLPRVIAAGIPRTKPGEPPWGITPSGEDRLPVADALESWLQDAPGGPIAYAGRPAERTIETLADAWGDTVLHALAGPPRTAEELAEQLDLTVRQLTHLLEPALQTDQIETVTTADGSVAYAPTGWGRRGIAPILLAARAERTNPDPEDAPIQASDFEAALQLTAPLASLPSELSGSCRLVVVLGRDAEPSQAAVMVTIERGKVLESVAGIDAEGEVDATAIGKVSHWFRALIDDRPKRLSFDGDTRLGRQLVKSLGDALFGGEG